MGKGRVMEVVKNYDIDGIHFDDYFYNEAYAGGIRRSDTYCDIIRVNFPTRKIGEEITPIYS